MAKPYLALLAGLVLALPLQAAPVPCTDPLPVAPLTLTVALDFALCRAPQTQSAWAQAKAQAAALDVARAARRPQLSATVGASQERSGGRNTGQQRASLQLAYTLFDFGQREARIDQADALFSAAQANTDATVATVWLNTSKAYFDTAKAGAQIDAAKIAENAARTNLAAAERRLAVGSATPLDVLQARAQLSQASLDRTKGESQLAVARGNLALAMGLSPTRLPALAALPTGMVASPLPAGQLDGLLATALNSRPEVRQSLSNLKAAEAAVRSARAAGKPTLSVAATASSSRVGAPYDTVNGGNIGVSLNIPFDLDGSTAAGLRSAEALAEAREADLQRTRQTVENDAWQAYYSLRSALDTSEAAEDVAANARKAYEAALARYQAGVSSLLDVLTAQTARANAEQQLIAARYDWYAARAALAYALGGALPADPTTGPSAWPSQP